MKTMKKLASLTLALLLTIALAAPAMATTVTINPPENAPEDLTETYKAYKIFDAKVDEEESKPGQTDPNGTTSDFTSVAYSINPAFSEVIANYTEGDPAKTVFVISEDGVVKLAEGVTTFDAAALAVELKKVIDNTPDFSANAEGNSLNLTDAGYYLIVGSLGSKAILDTVGKESVTIQTKNEFPTLTKKILVPDEEADDPAATKEADSTTASYGDTITFEITVNIPASVNDVITVTDTMDADLTYDDLVQPTTVTKAADSMTFTIPADTPAGEFKFQYTATLNNGAATATPHTNTAHLTYKTYDSAETTAVSVYTYEFDLIKTNSSNTVLSGATFELYDAETEGNKIALTAANGANADGTFNAGFVNIKGLAAGTYYLEETVAPDGYNRMTTRQAVTLGDTTDGKTGNLVYIPETDPAVGDTYVITDGGVQVVNLTGAELPSTGGIGTTIFYVVGGLLAVGAGVLLITRKRAGEEE